MSSVKGSSIMDMWWVFHIGTTVTFHVAFFSFIMKSKVLGGDRPLDVLHTWLPGSLDWLTKFVFEPFCLFISGNGLRSTHSERLCRACHLITDAAGAGLSFLLPQKLALVNTQQGKWNIFRRYQIIFLSFLSKALGMLLFSQPSWTYQDEIMMSCIMSYSCALLL